MGVDVGEISAEGVKTIANAIVNLQTAVFVDSSAFSAFRRGLRVGEVVPMDFDAILAKYDALLDAIAAANPAEKTDYPRPLLVMPDVVGDQAASLALVERYKRWIGAEATFNLSRPIVPLQKGELTLAQAYAKATSA